MKAKLTNLNNHRKGLMDTKEEFRKHVSDQVYHALQSAGDLCRLRCHEDPDLLDSVADGIWRFLCDGDIYDFAMQTLLAQHPEYFGHILANLETEVARAIIAASLE
jgi:hypothetical protein